MVASSFCHDRKSAFSLWALVLLIELAMTKTVHLDSVGEFCCVGSIFSMKLLGFVK